MLNLCATSYFIPNTQFDILESFQRFSLSKSQAKIFATFYGIKFIPIAEGMSMSEFVKRPVEMLLKQTKIDIANIKYIIHAHTATAITQFGKSIVNTVCDQLELDHVISFGTSLHNCASTLIAYEVAAKLLTQHDAQSRAIVITADRAFTPTMQIIPNTSITGDASAATMIGLNGQHDRMIHLEIQMAGEFYQGIWLNEEDQRKFAALYIPFFSKTIMQAVYKANISLSQVKLILPHNVNIISWQAVAKNINFPVEKIYLENVSQYAHCFGADIVINFTDAKKSRLLVPGDYYIMATVGLNATFAAAVFQH